MVNVDKKIRKITLFEGKTDYFYGHVQWLCNKLPECKFRKVEAIQLTIISIAALVSMMKPAKQFGNRPTYLTSCY